MSWLKIDDGFTENAKVLLLSDAALALWVRCACWARKRENHHTGGFIPAALLPTIARVPAAKAKRLAQELVDANAGGMKEHGLWEPREGGWAFHDWDDYLPPDEKLSPHEAASLAGKRSAEVRRERHGTAQPTKPRTTPNDSEPFEQRSAERPSENRSTNEDRTSRTPSPDPSPDPDPVPKNPSGTESSASQDSATKPPREPRRKPSRPIPDDWAPLDRHVAAALERGVNLTEAASKFRAHAESVDRRCADWGRAFDAWLLNERAGPPRGRPEPFDPFERARQLREAGL